jgi:hypothetical protein
VSAPVTAFSAYALARGLTISNRHTSLRSAWGPNDEQITLWQMLERYPALFCVKPRKTGISTASELWDVLWTWRHDAGNNPVRCVIAIDTDAKAQEHASQIVDFCKQLSITLKSSNAHGVQLANGSKIDCITAGGEDPGRGGQVHRLHVTELPFWRQPLRNYQALRSSCADTAQVLIETTMDLQNDPEWVAKLWDDAGAGLNEFHRHFWKVEDHRSYRSEKPITDEQWERAKAEGFRRRKAAAWWFHEGLQRCAGSELMLMHDFPQKEEHLFAAGLGRVILADPPVATVDGHLTVHGLRGDDWQIEVYGENVYRMDGFDYVYDAAGHPVVEDTVQIEHSGQVVITIDTAYGVKKTNSIVLAVDKNTRRILACFSDNTIKHDDLARVAQTMREFFSLKRAATFTHIYYDDVTVVCEADGIGDATATELMNIGCPHERFYQGNVDLVGNSNSARCVMAAKTHIEASRFPGPAILRTECRELVRDEKQQLKGRKDCVMMYGMANLVIDERPYQHPLEAASEAARKRRKGFEEALKDYEKERGGAGARPKWGT